MAFTDIWTIDPMPAEGAVIRGEAWRVTVLTDRLLRLEYEPEGRFCDTATQAVIDRAFPLPAFTRSEKNGWLTVETEAVRLQYDGRPFSPEGLSVTLKGQFWVRTGATPQSGSAGSAGLESEGFAPAGRACA